MIRLLTRERRDLLEQLAWSPVLLAFDFDGTLAPIVADRDAAFMRPETLALFRSVAVSYPVAVISGRHQADVGGRLGGAAVKYVVGNHGLEPGGDLARFAVEMREALAALEVALGPIRGVDIEDKRYSLAVHYRRARNRGATRQAIERAVLALPKPMRLVPGKMVVNVLPRDAPDKGDALLDLRRRESAAVALYVGDDVTDEDVFRIDQPGRLVSVRVGRARDSSAKYFLQHQGEIDELLARLAELRPHAVARG